MLAILYICHGSRMTKGVDQAKRFVKQCMGQVNVPIQRICYLELVRPDIQEGIGSCVRAGADCIFIQPILLLSAGHAKRDIPRQIAIARRIYPHVHFIYGRPFGTVDNLVEILLQRLREKSGRLTGKETVLIVGRGSSDPNIPLTFARIRQGFTKRGIVDVSVCYMAAARPRIADGLKLVLRRNPARVYIVPCLLFPGILTKTIKQEIETYNGRAAFVLCRTIGCHPALIRLFRKRIEAAVYDGFPSQY